MAGGNGHWYAITGGEHEGAWYALDYDTDILPYVEHDPCARVYGIDDGICSEADALARVSAHASARTAAASTAAIAAAVTFASTPVRSAAPPATPATKHRTALPTWASVVTEPAVQHALLSLPPGLATRAAVAQLRSAEPVAVLAAAAQPTAVEPAAVAHAQPEMHTPSLGKRSSTCDPQVEWWTRSPTRLLLQSHRWRHSR